MRPYYSHSSRENATPSSGTSPLGSCKGVPPLPGHQLLRAHTRPKSSRLEPKYCFGHSNVQYTDFSLHLYTVTQTEESKSRRKAEHEDLLNVRNGTI